MDAILRRVVRWCRRGGRSDRLAATHVVSEAEAILSGTAADRFAARRSSVPYWAWLNTVAHRPPAAIRAAAVADPRGRWSQATLDIADELDRAGPAEAVALQVTVLIPAELQALADGKVLPDAVVRAVRRARAETPPGAEAGP